MKDRFHTLGELMASTYEDGNLQDLQILVLEYLNLAAQNKKDWNYGNAIHQANIYSGLIALENGQIEEAKKYLIKAGNTPGSPQLNNFGPNMLLAKKLLEIGETEVVLKYIDRCKGFWKFIFRIVRVNKWKKEIKQGKIPDFRAHLHYHITYPVAEK